MIKEKYILKTSQFAVNVEATRVDSIRKKDITKTAMRVYLENKIGVAGGLGMVDEQELTEKAMEALELEISYPVEPSSDLELNMVYHADFSSEEEFVHEIEELLAEMSRQQPDFSFSNKATLTTIEASIKNNLGLDLFHRGTFLELGFAFKFKGSGNIFDGFIGYEGLKYDRKEFMRITNEICEAYKNKIEDFKAGKYPVVFLLSNPVFLIKLYRDLHGLIFATGGSLLSGKIGQKLFNDTFTLYQTRNHIDGFFGPFFDAEGIVNKDFRYPLIENGILRSPYTDKKTAKIFNLPQTGAAAGEYDSVPDIGVSALSIKESDKTLKELLDGREAIFVLIASGGDFTPDGSFATPVQLPLLFDGERFIGRLPELNISSNLFDMFGKNFIGVGKDNLTNLGPSKAVIMEMEVSKI
ncbi:metallopeptidase TldD-related protein [Kosmotoga pacifica]|uniref:Peptidase U62 n=1 Tax=Kosmotoga pacifica TaxID=1330330 RepID=A0A0G2Z8S6_9BACT|nr:metallopeptidase TldD-related protein [Kosmotoga pacifica]AKI97962.1 peptidase U62 [Kosmotoga pacifica]